MSKYLAIASFLGAATLSSAGVYSINSGIPNGDLGFGGSTSLVYWSTSFTVAAGNETITSVDAMIGRAGTGSATNGSAIRVSVSHDADHDGIADAGGLLADLNTVVSGANTNIFTTFDTADVTLSVGDGFVVSCLMESNAANPSPVALDSSASVAGRNFIAFGAPSIRITSWPRPQTAL